MFEQFIVMHTLVCRSYKCSKEAKYKCSDCMVAVYCSEECQEDDWYKRHHKECKKMKELHKKGDKKGTIGTHIGFDADALIEDFEGRSEKWENFWNEHNQNSLRLLGSGTYGAVFRVTGEHRDEFALKAFFGGPKKEYIATETAIQQYVSKKCFGAPRYYGAGEIKLIKPMKKALLGVFEIYDDDDVEEKKKKVEKIREINKMDVILVSKIEFVKGKNLEAFSFVSSANTFFQIAIQLLDQLTCLHVNGLLHNDIKPENVMIDGNMLKINRVTLIDYGLACSDKEYRRHTEDTKKFECGEYNVGPSYYYVAPEVILSRKQANTTSGFLTKASDVWSLAATFITMTIDNNERYEYFPNKNPAESIWFAEEEWDWIKGNTPITRDSKIKRKIAKIVIKMINENPEKRLTAREALQQFKALNRKK